MAYECRDMMCMWPDPDAIKERHKRRNYLEKNWRDCEIWLGTS